MKKNTYAVVYLVLIFMILLVPFTGMTFWATNETAEKTELAEWPKLANEGKWNENYLQEMGTYFEDHFAFREKLVTANAVIRSKTVGSAVLDRVIVGENDWLYFKGTLPDYLGKDQLSDRQLFMAAKNLKIMQDYTTTRGAQFLFVSPFNKNTVYDENMPDRYLKADENNLDRLEPLLTEHEVNYLDLKPIFEEQEKPLYFARDTHWNNEGALLAYQSIMDYFSLPHETYLNVPSEERTDHIGDIDEMLYPTSPTEESNRYYPHQYATVGDFTDNMDAWIETNRGEKANRLLMYRDSFGESLLPFMADEFAQGYFSRYVPYNLLQVDQYQPTHVVIERAERTLGNLLTDIPIMTAPIVPMVSGETVATATELSIKKDNDYYLVEGTIDPKYLKDNTEIYVSVHDTAVGTTVSYQPFYVSKDDGDGSGYQLYLVDGQLPESLRIEVLTVETGQATTVYTTELAKGNIQ